MFSILYNPLSLYRDSLIEEKKILRSKDEKYIGKKGEKKRLNDFSKQRIFTDEMLSTLTSNMPI